MLLEWLKFKKSDQNRRWCGYGETGALMETLVCYWWGCNIVQTL